MKSKLSLLFILIQCSLWSQIDTNYIQRYTQRLTVGIFQSVRQYDVLLNSSVFDSENVSQAHYLADANNVTGLSIDYGIIGFSFGFKSTADNPYKKGNTEYASYGLNINSKGLRLENSYRSYKGFYDVNTAAYDTTYDDTKPYYQNKDLSITSLKSKGIYIFNNNRFSLRSAYANTERQMKTSATWLLAGNVYFSSIQSSIGIIPQSLRQYYDSTRKDLSKINTFGISAGPGASVNLVAWKRFYLNLLLSLGLEMQHRNISTLTKSSYLRAWKPSAAADWRISFGFNNRNFFMRLNNTIDFNNLNEGTFKLNSKYLAGELSLGYRFKVKPPRFYQKFKDGDFYKRHFTS